jgi:hypothetical protein
MTMMNVEEEDDEDAQLGSKQRKSQTSSLSQ